MQKISKATLVTNAILALATIFALAPLSALAIYNPEGNEQDITTDTGAQIRALTDDEDIPFGNNDLEDIMPINDNFEDIEPINSENAESTNAENDPEDLSWMMWVGGAALVLIVLAILFAIRKNKK